MSDAERAKYEQLATDDKKRYEEECLVSVILMSLALFLMRFFISVEMRKWRGSRLSGGRKTN